VFKITWRTAGDNPEAVLDKYSGGVCAESADSRWPQI